MPKHGPELLAEFQDGETRLIYARSRADVSAPLYYLKDGTATQLRHWAKEHLECFMPECADRRLTTVARTGKRDGFKHYTGAGGHSAEGLFHQQAKALIVRWVAETHPEVRAVPEQVTVSGERRADVMLTWPDGRQVAVEIQYAGLSVEEWRARHDSYRRQGVVDVWMFGHTGPHLRSTGRVTHVPGVPGGVVLGALHHAMVEARVPLLWINPIQERLATSWTCEEPDVFQYSGPDSWDGLRLAVPPVLRHCEAAGFFGADPIRTCTVAPDGIHTPTLEVLLSNATRLAEISHERRKRHAARLAEVERRARARAEREAELKAMRARHRRWWLDQQREWRRAWLTSGLRSKVLARYGGIPEVISARTEPSEGVHAFPDEWHAKLYGALLLALRPGTRLTVSEACDLLRAEAVPLAEHDANLLNRTVVSYLRHLAAHGHVRLRMKDNGRYVEAIKVVGPIERVRQLEERQARRREAEEAAAQERLRDRAERRERERHDELARQAAELAQLWERRAARAHEGDSAPETRMPRRPVQTLRCVRCSLPLDPVLADSGRHLGC